MSYLPSNLKILRKNFGYTQAALSNRLLCRRSTYAVWEQGRAGAETKELKILSDFFGVSIDYLVRKDLSTYEAKDIINNYHDIQMRLNQ